MEEGDDINGMENNDNPGTQGNSLGMVPPGVDGADGNQEANENSDAIGQVEPEQLTKAQQATVNELKRLASKNTPGPGQGSGLVHGPRRRESTIVSAKTTFEILSQQFGESLEDLGKDYVKGKRTRDQIRSAYRELNATGDRLGVAAEELQRAQERAGAVEEAQWVHDQMLQFEARMGSLRQQLGPEITDRGGSVRSRDQSLTSAGDLSRASSTSSKRRLVRAELLKKKAEERFRQEAGRLEMEEKKRAAKLAAEEVNRAAEAEFRIRELERQGDMVGLEAEMQALEDDGSTSGRRGTGASGDDRSQEDVAGLAGNRDGKAVAIDGKVPVLAISPAPVTTPGNQERFQAPLEVNVIEKHYGTDASMGQEGNRNPSGQGEQMGTEGNQGKEPELVQEKEDERGESTTEWDCKLCKGEKTVCTVRGQRWCNRCRNRGIHLNPLGSEEREGNSTGDERGWQPHGHLLDPVRQTTGGSENPGGAGSCGLHQRQEVAGQHHHGPGVHF